MRAILRLILTFALLINPVAAHAGASITTWGTTTVTDAYVGSGDLTFSNGNATVTKTGGHGNTFRSGRSGQTIPAGDDGSITFVVSGMTSGANTIIGLCKSTQTFGSGDYIGVNANGAGLSANGSAYVGGGAGSGGSTFANGDTVTLRWTRSGANTLIATKTNGGSFSADVTASNLNTGSIYVCYTTYVDGDAFAIQAAAPAGRGCKLSLTGAC